MNYRAQTSDICHALFNVSAMDELVAQGVYPDLSADLIDAIVEEAGRFATDIIAPLNRQGDQIGARLENSRVIMPPGWAQAYSQWVKAGWGALPGEEEYGGQGLPLLLSLATQELWNCASMAFGIGTVLTQGAVEALIQHGTDELKSTYLPKLTTGEWMGTMNLTESQSGSDLGGIRTKAERCDDGTYRIKGTKIFITYGDHDLSDNIIHFVLARLHDAPEGIKGISLFLVPNYLVNPDGSLGVKNDVTCASLEHKLGIHASATCVMAYGENEGAVGYLVGTENRGLYCMFTMMNNARLHVGIQGVAIAERATQQAVVYAQERKQGTRPGDKGPVAIINHPDIRAMLMTMKSMTAAARAICYQTARAIDLQKLAPSEDRRQKNADRASLLTPVAKAFSTDVGVEVSSLGVQVHGGMGYIEETGAAQHFRDARIAPIYEGTNGIQAIDLVTRRLALQNGDTVREFIAELKQTATEISASNLPAYGNAGPCLVAAVEAFEKATIWMQQAAKDEPDQALAGATSYLRLFGLTAGAGFLAQGTQAQLRKSDTADPTSRDKNIALLRYLAEHHLPETISLATTIITSGDALLAIPDDQFQL
jgi:3-(methylsulfanyl)propanoyl-CoA dehydrogenase